MDLIDKSRKLMCLQVEYNLNKMELYSEEGTYDCRNVPKLMEKFERINKNSYGALLDFVYHVSFCKKYYVCEQCRRFAVEICNCIRRFIDGYYPVLS